MSNINLNLEHLYISPLEICNLSCKLCYTQKTPNLLTFKHIKQFIEQYVKAVAIRGISLQTITFCGGEFFLLDYATDLINWSCEQGYFVQIITNGTVDKLSKIKYPNSVNLLVSVDGIEKWHDMNRGKGNFIKGINFIKKAQKLSFHTEVFSLVWRENFKDIGEFEKYVEKELRDIPITYQLRKNISFLNQHPVTNVNNAGYEFGFLTIEQIKWLMNNKKTFPPKDLGCYQISLMSNGKVYSCCEGVKPLCEMIDDKGEMIRKYLKRISAGNNLIPSHCSLVTNCAEPEFCCGLCIK
ncbi:MAG TPA: radical SAM protein [Candidatus Dojkabacteria bacterium]|nr:radical SAM protein [Candidatus Dojkabacteria bacterium]HQF36026.1 radical SAM protein [Candidatus Dojkabacteria bacterium]